MYFTEDADSAGSWLDSLNTLTNNASSIIRAVDTTYQDVERTFGGSSTPQTAIALNRSQVVQGQAAGNGRTTFAGPISASGIAAYLKSPRGQQAVMVGLALLAAYVFVLK